MVVIGPIGDGTYRYIIVTRHGLICKLAGYTTVIIKTGIFIYQIIIGIVCIFSRQ